MIESIQFRNFQSHADSSLNFHPGINALIGSSDSGKTAVLRALYWAVNNRPSGEAFVSNWTKDKKGKQKDETWVRIKNKNGVLTRQRSSDFNGYIVNAETFEAIKTDVPEQVEKFFNLGETNIQRQMDAPFLLSNTPGEVARFFNKIIKLEAIDQALSSIDSRKRENKAKTIQLQESLSNYETQEKKYFWIEDAEKLIERALKLETKLNDSKDLLSKLNKSLSQYEEQARILKKIPDIDTLEDLVSEANVIYLDAKNRNDILVSLNSSLNSYENAKNIVDSPRLSIISIEISVNRAIKLNETIKTNKELSNNYSISLKNYQNFNETIKKQDETLKKYTEMLPDLCPLCNSPMNKDSI